MIDLNSGNKLIKQSTDYITQKRIPHENTSQNIIDNSRNNENQLLQKHFQKL